MTTAIWWIRRDMRLADNKALQSAAQVGDVIPLFVVDPTFAKSGLARQAFMYDSLRALNDSMGGALVLKHGDPILEVLACARETGATSVHIASDFAPYGMRRDAAVEAALAANDIALVHADSPYCVNPGVVLKDDGTPVKVFTPFFRRWSTHEVTSAVESSVSYAEGLVRSAEIPVFDSSALRLPPAGEAATWERWESWSPDALALYKEDRNNPGVDGTSRLSAQLRFGVVHPRQLIAQLDGSAGAEVFRSELAWREFYADVLFHQPLTAWQNLQKKMDVLPIDTSDAAKQKFATFCAAQTGYPIVDAGIRQMLATGWMHNRVRMIVASFLVKDLHVPWQWGAKFFMKHLVDGDIASNNHGWQWTAGTGTDASPYYRVFNPTTQSAKFDPTGGYLREWIPEIASLDNTSIHEPSSLGLLAPEGYPAPMVDHAVERNESLARYKAVSGK